MMDFKRDVIGLPQSKSLSAILKEKGFLSTTVVLITILLALYHIYTSFAGCPPAILHRGIHLFVILIVVFLHSSVRNPDRGYLALNIFLSFLALSTLIYIASDYDEMLFRYNEAEVPDLVFSAITLGLTIEACRRVVGVPMAILVCLFLVYTWLGQYVPGEFGHAGFSWREILDQQFLSYNGVFTTPLGVMSTFIIIFLIFAGFLMKSGAVQAFMEIAIKLMGRTSGGPAKAAVVASALMGSVSGSAAANVMVTGSISIPLMKRLGYPPSFAGAVEASVSSGGQFMPPIMGASAFIIASVLGIPYIKVCLHALIPALLWFFCFFITLHFEAKKRGMQPIDREEIPSTRRVLTHLYLFIPLAALVYLMTRGYSPMYAGAMTVFLLLVLVYFRRETRMNLSAIISALEYGIMGALPVTAACAGAGIIVGCVMQSGVGYYLSAALVRMSGGHLYLLLPLVIAASLLLGMGMVTVGAYIIVSILVSPALIDMGVPPIAAHLFPFYFAILSAITPPVAVASYAAAGIAGASPWETGVLGIRLAIPALFIPFVFITQPSLLFLGPPLTILVTIGTSVAGVFCLASVTVGYLIRTLRPFERMGLAIAAIAFFFPVGIPNLLGAGILALVTLLQRRM
jgi:TRAP transporter 4TM/12TM fusion protein